MCQLTFNNPPAGQVNQVHGYSPGMKLGAIKEDYRREESSSDEDLSCDDDSFNFKDISLISCTRFGANDLIPPLPVNSDIVAMLQQQQVMSQQIVESQ